jgi:nickel-dependent lactate racemase
VDGSPDRDMTFDLLGQLTRIPVYSLVPHDGNCIVRVAPVDGLQHNTGFSGGLLIIMPGLAPALRPTCVVHARPLLLTKSVCACRMNKT